MIRLYHAHQTRSMRTLWLLNELGVAFSVIVRPFDASLRDPDYLSVSPAGRVPSLEIDGASMFETGAISEYLCERFPAAQQHVVIFEDHMRSPTVMKIEAKRLGKCYAALEARLTSFEGSGNYLLGSGFSACDIACGQAVYAGQHYAKLDGFPALQDWYARLAARPAFKAALPPQGEGIYAQDFYPIPESAS